MLTVLVDAGNLGADGSGVGDGFSVQTMVYWVFYLLTMADRHYYSWWVVVVDDRLTPGHLVRNQNRIRSMIAKYSHHFGNILKIHPV